MKILCKIATVLMLAMVAGYGVYNVNKSNNSGLSNLVLDNIEALARYEFPDVEIVCGESGGQCWIEMGYCYRGEYTIEDCARTSSTSVSCSTDC